MKNLNTQSNNSYHESLVDLKNKLGKGAVSVMIGAGFSLNFDNRFPTWSQLLEDLVLDLYGDQIELEFALSKSTKSIPKNYEDFKKNKINKYIKEIGHLEIVSLYIKRKGYSEAISNYIEQKVPFLVNENGKNYIITNFKGNNLKEEFDIEKLKVHNLLLQLPWNNIYTTNYDNLIEYCINQETKKELEQVSERTRQELDSNTKESQSLKEEILSIRNEIAELIHPNKIELNNFILDTQIPPQENKELSAQKAKLNSLEREVRDLENSNNGLSQKVVFINSLQEELNSVIVHSSELALKRNKNIIKINGTLRMVDEEKYGFDNDPHNHYIISKEDFDNYPQRHEAFTQLMRISLLKDAFA